MNLDKAIEFGKEKRRKYRGAKAIDPSCRNHGSFRCREDRMYSTRKAEQEAEEKYKDWEDEEAGNVEPDLVEKNCESDMYEEYLAWVQEQKKSA
jgi:hypothetical protein